MVKEKKVSVEPEDTLETLEEATKPIKQIPAGTWVSFIVTFVAVINAVFLIFGKDLGLKIDENAAYQIVSAIMLFGATGHAWWKDNDVTTKARERKEQIKKEDK